MLSLRQLLKPLSRQLNVLLYHLWQVKFRSQIYLFDFILFKAFLSRLSPKLVTKASCLEFVFEADFQLPM